MIKKAYKLYAEKYGNVAQIIKSIEELAELQMALAKYLNHQSDIENIIEEIADVEIMTTQLKMMFNCAEKVNDWKDLKVDRMIERAM